MFLIIFHLSVVLSLTVQKTVSTLSNLTRAAPLEIQTVVMEERIFKLMSLFKLTSPDTATAVVFGHHSRYFCDMSIVFLKILFHRHSLGLPSVRLDENAPPPRLSTFSKNHFLILEEGDLEQATTVMERVARMFNQYPAFTIILGSVDPKQSKLENNGNSPLVFIKPRQVFLNWCEKSSIVFHLLASLWNHLSSRDKQGNYPILMECSEFEEKKNNLFYPKQASEIIIQ